MLSIDYRLAPEHKATERAIRASGIPFTILRNGWYTENWTGTLGAALEAGALIGSLLMYALLRRGSEATLRQKYGDRLEWLDRIAARGGILPIIGLRLAGVPHVAVTAVCALALVEPKRYALATIVGVFPAIALSALAGASV